MQTLDVISVNVWQILISLINLVLLFLILKKFLYKPVKKMLQKRKEELDAQYQAAEDAEQEAQAHRAEWEAKLSTADEKATEILQNATENAKRHGERLVEEAQQKAEGIIRVAQNEAELERKKATEDIKREIVEVSGALTEKMLAREINAQDHHALIESFIENIGEEDDGNN
ncbi:MAG: F0F1 ATP synthase subunit B [Clostridia bacterium]|nr:F0F1 ATP synthase subunit B [Clostridia bacterium]